MNVVHSSGTITIRVLPDDGPEAEEVYILQLVTASGSAAIDPSANIVRIIVRENIQKTLQYVTTLYRSLNVEIHLAVWDLWEKPFSLRILLKIQTLQLTFPYPLDALEETQETFW